MTPSSWKYRLIYMIGLRRADSTHLASWYGRSGTYQFELQGIPIVPEVRRTEIDAVNLENQVFERKTVQWRQLEILVSNSDRYTPKIPGIAEIALHSHPE
jgi:hypothetical protein